MAIAGQEWRFTLPEDTDLESVRFTDPHTPFRRQGRDVVWSVPRGLPSGEWLGLQFKLEGRWRKIRQPIFVAAPFELEVDFGLTQGRLTAPLTVMMPLDMGRYHRPINRRTGHHSRRYVQFMASGDERTGSMQVAAENGALFAPPGGLPLGRFRSGEPVIDTVAVDKDFAFLTRSNVYFYHADHPLSLIHI